jgi:hypothetical protein
MKASASSNPFSVRLLVENDNAAGDFAGFQRCHTFIDVG